MKILIGLIIIVAVIWLVRAARKDIPLAVKRQPPANQPDNMASQGEPAAMLQCHRCGLHLPTDEAVRGRLGAYCTEAHRRLAEN